jgi:putative acyl-CoA dehydrogenase
MVPAYKIKLASAQGLDKRFDTFLNGLKDGDAHVAEGFVASRIHKPAGLNYGTLPVGVNCKAIIERAKPLL